MARNPTWAGRAKTKSKGVPLPPSGIEPLGTVRRSQLISTYGVGAIVDLEKGSFMPMGLEDWEGATRDPSLAIREARLEAQLGVSHFRLAPIAEQIEGSRRVEARSTAPAVRFPEWHECPKCHRLGKEGEPFELAPDGSRLVCRAHGAATIHTTPVRFVTACRKGHISDFPWEWWAHRRHPAGVCENPSLYLKSRGRSASLADLYVECRSCKMEKGFTSQSMGNAFGPESLSGVRCTGWRPWLHDRQADCDAGPRVIQRGASNVHFPIVASALSIPPISDGAFQIIEGHWMVLGALSGEAIDPVLQSLARNYNIAVEPLFAAYRKKKSIEDGSSDLTDIASRNEEYAALSADRDDEIIGGLIPHFQNRVVDPPPSLSRWFDLVGAVSRLREVRALAGFSRIDPYPVSAEKVPQAIIDGFVAALSKTPRTWLPAAEIRGEGLFIRFRSETVDAWIESNPGLAGRIAVLDAISERMASERSYSRDYGITPRLLLIHSFAHAFIRQISIECGYSSSALRERLYVAEANDSAPAMNGVLVYTGSPDSEGSLGGLVRLAEPALLEAIVNRTIACAGWCGSDPVCLETEPAQSGDRVGGAACHCCLLVPETACEKFNRELDRTMLVGDIDGAFAGYFDQREP